MYRFQGTGNRSNGIYCEPDTTPHQHHFTSPHTKTKQSKIRSQNQHRSGRVNQRSHHQHHIHRNDTGMDSEVDSSSEVSDGNYQDSDPHMVSMSGRMTLPSNNDSPPEPAPTDMSLRMNGALRTLKSNYGDMDGESEHPGYHLQPGSTVYIPQEYIMSSPYQPKSPMPMGASLATAKKLFQSDNLQNETGDSNSTLSTLPSQARLIGGMGVSANTNPMMTGIPSAPVILPVFPNSTPHPGQITGNGGLQSTRSLPRSQYSPSRFTLQKDCRVSDRCTWKCGCVAMIILCVCLISTLIYLAATTANCSRYPGNGCIVVEDAKVMARGEKHLPVITDHTSISPKSNEVEMVSPTSLVPEVTSSRDYHDFNDGLAPVEITWGQMLSRRIEPYSYWTLEMNMRESGYVNLNLSIPWGTNWALFLRKNALPSITQHDIVKVIKNGRLEQHRSKRRRHIHETEPRIWSNFQNNLREVNNSISNTDIESLFHRTKRDMFNDPSVVVLTEYLDSGKWFLRIFNDDILQRKFNLLPIADTNAEIRCPQQCSGNGNCVYGKCQCFDGFTGIDCSTSVCPVLCSNHGRYGGGLCHCDAGWKGVECDIPESECEIGNCNGNGDCITGKCACRTGYTGENCDQRDCLDPTCSQHGMCIQGRCLCDAGWAGHTCSFPDSFLSKCLPDCTERGEFVADSGKCICQKPYGGPNCAEVVCEQDCGTNGICNNAGQCECLSGWTGDQCDMLTCDSRCSEHGQCKNGTCICSQGWNGKHCTLAGCPNSCTNSDHGSCIMQDGYSCKCKNGWAGLDCSIRLETNCADDIDNDEDGMTDCSDSECCESPACKEHLMCMTANDPVEVLLRKQPPSVTSSFYQRVKFLIEEESVQSYAQKDEYWESHFWSSFEHRRVSVIRGQVLSSDGLGIVGIRVSVDKSQRLGFTLTRKGGWFDMLVNGGGSVTLQFQRNPFRPLTRTVFVPWNEIVVIDPPIVMTVGGNHLRDLSQEENPVTQSPCLIHDLDKLSPIVISSWFPEMVGANSNGTLVFGETQILQESIGIPGSDVHLLYHSSQSSGYLATILIQLTQSEIPTGLALVHLKIIIEGELYRKTFEADPNITYTFGWRKRNVYQQKVYGLAVARVSIGYEYSSCAQPIWTTRTVTLKGFDVDIADVGGWNLDIHHHYNFHEGILQKGDGSEVHLKEMPRRVKTFLGRKGQQRSLNCEPSCDTILLSPVALTTGPDGSIYVGDFNMIRRITPDNRTYTIVLLPDSKVSHQYYMTISPADGHLYISDPEKYQVLRVNRMDDIPDVRINLSPVVGTGVKCVPGDPENCGDGFPGKLAKLNHPKGLAITSGGSIYIADGPNIRLVNSHGTIYTLIGKQSPWTVRGSLVRTSDFDSCRVFRADASKVQLHWPTSLALNLVENKIFFIDEGNLFWITEDNQVERVLKCEMSQKIVRPVLDLVFSPKGKLYFVTEDSNLYSVREDGVPALVRTDNVPPYYSISTSSGESSRNNLDAGSVSALSIGPDSTIYIADQAYLELKQVSHYIPIPNSNGDYEVVYPATGEVYIFNRYGQHTFTKDLKSGKVLYTFLYTKNTSYGKLSKISDSAENKILFLRDYSSVVSTIENTQGKKCSLKINRLGRLVHFQEMENSEIRLEYSEDGLLLAKVTTTGLSSLYNYDTYGRVKKIIGETGTITSFEYGLSGPSIQVRVSDSSNENAFTFFQVFRNEETDQVTIKQLQMDEAFLQEKTISTDVKNATYSVSTVNGNEMLGMSWGLFPHLKNIMPSEGNVMRAPSFQYIHDPETPDVGGNKQELKFGVLGDIIGTERILDRQIWVNDSRVLTLEFDQSLSREVVYNYRHEPIITIQYDSTGLPLYFVPATNQAHRFPMNITYDRFNRMESWKWGLRRGHQVSYARNGFATEIKSWDNQLLKTIEYNDHSQPSKILLGSGREYLFQYDTHGGLKWMETPKNTRHTFTFQHSVGFSKLVYQPPGSSSPKNSFVKHYKSDGLLQTKWLPMDSGRIFYQYDYLRRPTAVLYSEGKINYKYKGHITTISSSESKFEPVYQILTNKLDKVIQEKQEFGSKSGFASGMFSYAYDSNFRPTSVKSRIGGHPLDLAIAYDSKTGTIEQLGRFKINRSPANVTIADENAVFSRLCDGYGRPDQLSLSIQNVVVFKLDYTYEPSSHRIKHLKLLTKTIGFSDHTYSPSKNFTYDVDGQLVEVDSVEPWKFEYDGNSNLKSLTYRGNTIPLEYTQQDRIVRFADGIYRYDSAGRVIQNAKEEYFSYNSLGQLKRAWKRGRFDIEYYYDHQSRLVGRKDNHGNLTQFFYADVLHQDLVTHIYNPKENRLIHLVYDDTQRLIFYQVNRVENFYVACDHRGTPTLVFNQYGLVVRELSRSPYGHIVYDSDPTFYLPIDFSGGILDKVTSLIHMRRKRVYDPLIGQFLTPDWEDIPTLLTTPERIHLYRLDGNDPINFPESAPPFDHASWLKIMGYDLGSLSPQLFPLNVGLKSPYSDLVISGLEHRIAEKTFDLFLLQTIPRGVVTQSILIPNPAALIAQTDPPLGKNIILSRTAGGKGMISSCPTCTSNRVDRDVFTQILNGSEYLSYVSHSPAQDVFHFVKKELWKASDDLADLKRLGGQVNVTVHDRPEDKSKDQTMELKIHMSGSVLFLKYGTTGSREETKLIHHAKSVASRKAWANIKDLIQLGIPISEFTAKEKEEILKNGHLSSHHPEYTHDPEKFPIFADDPFNVKFATKRSKSSRNRSNSNNHH